MSEDFKEAWLAVPLGFVVDFLADQADSLWSESKGSDEAGVQYDRVESLRASLERVLGWLATARPPAVSVEVSQPFPVLGGRQRARGRVCFKCRLQIRSTHEMVTVCPVWMPGLPMHESCLRELEEEFGGRL